MESRRSNLMEALAMVAAATLAIAACVGVLAGYGGKEATSSLALEHSKSVPIFHEKTQSLDDEGIKMPDMPAMPDMSNVEMPKVEVPDPAETTRKAQEAMSKATGAAGEAISAAEDAVKAILPEGFDFIHALSWHLDICVYIATMYTVYYIWLCNLWEKILPKLNFRFNKAAAEKAKFEKLNNKTAAIGVWGRPNESEAHGPNDMDLLWFRMAKGEEALFAESQRVMPDFIDTLMCGCGGNVYAVCVTNKRIIVQHDKRCLFRTTVLTTNEESYFIKNVHKANLNTDGSLNVVFTTLHSAEMLSGGFNWIFFGFVIDLILEWKPTLMDHITDERMKGWINMVPNDVIFMFASALVIFGTFLFCALLFFLMCPQSVLEVEFVKQAGVKSYTKKFAYPVRLAYHMHDAIMQGRFGRGK